MQAPTWVMNPLVPQHGEIISEAFDNDAVSASAEYGAEFRTDVESFLSREAVEACIEAGTRERPPLLEHVYSAFCDPSGGSSDSMTLAISHFEGKTAVLDCIREVKPPFSPEAAVLEFAALLKAYRCTKVVGDRYGGEWVAESFRRAGVYYEASEKTKNDIYREILPLVNSRGVALLDDKKLASQLVSLERRVSRGGKDSVIIHPAPTTTWRTVRPAPLLLARSILAGFHRQFANSRTSSRRAGSGWLQVSSDRVELVSFFTLRHGPDHQIAKKPRGGSTHPGR